MCVCAYLSVGVLVFMQILVCSCFFEFLFNVYIYLSAN